MVWERSYGPCRHRPTNAPAEGLRSLWMRLVPMRDRTSERKEKRMEFAPQVPAWLTWFAAGVIGVFAIAALARTLEAVFDLDPS
jgi:hypothetical protein